MSNRLKKPHPDPPKGREKEGSENDPTPTSMVFTPPSVPPFRGGQKPKWREKEGSEKAGLVCRETRKPFLFQFNHITPTGGGIFASEIMLDGIGKDFCLTIAIFLCILLGTKDYCFCAV